MTRVFRFLGVLVLFHASAAHSRIESVTKPENVFTDDQRVKVTNDHAPWSAIGKLVLPDGDSHCTASLVSPNIIVTAAHCVIDPSTHTLMDGTFTFYPGMRDGQASTSSTVNWVWWGTAFPGRERSEDWALLRLNDRLGDSVGWLGVQDLDLGAEMGKGKYYMGAYSSDFDSGNSASWEKGCSFMSYDVDHKYYLHNCDASRGSSGAAMFYYTDESNPGTTNYIVALNVAEYRDGGAKSLIGIPYTPAHANIAIPASRFHAKLNEIR